MSYEGIYAPTVNADRMWSNPYILLCLKQFAVNSYSSCVSRIYLQDSSSVVFMVSWTNVNF